MPPARGLVSHLQEGGRAFGPEEGPVRAQLCHAAVGRAEPPPPHLDEPVNPTVTLCLGKAKENYCDGVHTFSASPPVTSPRSPPQRGGPGGPRPRRTPARFFGLAQECHKCAPCLFEAPLNSLHSLLSLQWSEYPSTALRVLIPLLCLGAG